VCMFDIVPSLGPQSQVLHPAEASVFVQVSIPSTRSTIDIHYKYLLHNYTSTMFPWERSSTRHRCPSPNTGVAQDRAQCTIPGSRSEDRRKGPLALPYPNHQLLYVVAISSKQGLSHHIFPYPNLTHSSNSMQQIISKHGNQGIQ